MNNKVNLTGRIANDLNLSKIKYTGKDGEEKEKDVLNFSLAVRNSYSNEADFFPVTFFGKDAVNLSNLCEKGNMISVEGHVSKDKNKHLILVEDHFTAHEYKKKLENVVETEEPKKESELEM